MHAAGQRPPDPQDLAVRAGDELQVHAVPLVLPGVEGPGLSRPGRRGSGSRRSRRTRAQPPSRPAAPAPASGRGRQAGAWSRRNGQAAAMPALNPAASSANVSPLRRCAGTSRACWPGFSFRQHDPIRARCRRMTPGDINRVWRDNGSAARYNSMEAPGSGACLGRPLHLPGASLRHKPTCRP
jgi:hypothetical protein